MYLDSVGARKQRGRYRADPPNTSSTSEDTPDLEYDGPQQNS